MEVINVTREDGVEPTPVREELLSKPLNGSDFFRVPRILNS